MGQTIRNSFHATHLHVLMAPGCVYRDKLSYCSDMNGVGSIRTGVFVSGLVSGFQMSPYSLWTFLTGVVWTGDYEINDTPMSQYRFGSGSVMVCVGMTVIERTPPPPPILCKEGSLDSTT